jgi:hypothetical protein
VALSHRSMRTAKLGAVSAKREKWGPMWTLPVIFKSRWCVTSESVFTHSNTNSLPTVKNCALSGWKG